MQKSQTVFEIRSKKAKKQLLMNKTIIESVFDITWNDFVLFLLRLTENYSKS